MSHRSAITGDIIPGIQWLMVVGPVSAVGVSEAVGAVRAPRKRLSLAVSLLVQGEELTGYCMNVSSSGMLILLPEELPQYLVWALGYLTGVVEDEPFRIKVRIARADEERVGVAFQISQPNDRELIRTLLDSAAPEPAAEQGREAHAV